MMGPLPNLRQTDITTERLFIESRKHDIVYLSPEKLNVLDVLFWKDFSKLSLAISRQMRSFDKVDLLGFNTFNTSG